MFASMQRHNTTRQNGGATINIAPLIDVVFILLIFFMVTTTFVQDRGIPVTRPAAAHAQALEPDSLRISVVASGAIYIEGREMTLPALREHVIRYVERHRDAPVVIIPDESLSSGRLVEVMDEVKRGGAGVISIATGNRQP